MMNGGKYHEVFIPNILLITSVLHYPVLVQPALGIPHSSVLTSPYIPAFQSFNPPSCCLSAYRRDLNHIPPIPGSSVSPICAVASAWVLIGFSNARKDCSGGHLQPSISSVTCGFTLHAFICATLWDLRGLPFSQPWNMQFESIARWRASPFHPKT